MTQFVSFILISFVGITSFARTTMPQQQFQELTRKVVETGTATQVVGSVYLTVSEISNLPDANSHQADYVSTIGNYDKTGVYHFNRVEIVSEKWHRTEDGRWDIDQWLFAATPQGESSFIRHVHLVRTVSGTVLIHETIPSEEKEEQTQWESQLNQWYTRLLTPKPIH